MKRLEIRADTWRNRLYLVLNGFFNDDELEEAADKAIQEVKKLRPGFDIITDISSFKPASPRGAEEMKRAQIFVQGAGVDRVIRVMPSATIGSIQFSRMSREAGYAADAASSMKEAEEMLGAWWLKSVGQES